MSEDYFQCHCYEYDADRTDIIIIKLAQSS